MKKLFSLLLATLLVSAVFCAAFLAPMSASAAGTNLAQGKRITGADPTNGNQYTDKYNASLLDGLASDEFDPNGAPGDWFSYYYNSNEAFPSNAVMTDSGVMGSFTIDLAGTASVESIRIHMFATDAKKSSGIQPPHRIVVEYSADNTNWSSFGERTDFSGCKDIDWVEISADSAVNAQYIKVSIYYAGPTLLLNEVQVIGEAKETGTIPADARFEVFDLTPADDDVNWYQDGIVVAIPNESDKELTVVSGEYQLRYVFILIFDKDGVCVEVGNNLLSEDDEKAAGFPQHDVKIPAGGFAVFFYYNADEGPANLALYEYYEALGGTMYSNETGKPASGKNYMAVIENNTVTVYFAAAEAPAESASPEESSEESTDEPAESSSEAPSAAEESSTATSSTEAPSPSSGASEASPATSSQAEESSSNTGVIVGVIIAVVAVAAVVVVVLVVRKKK